MNNEYNLSPYHNHPDSLVNVPVTPLMVQDFLIKNELAKITN